MGWIYRAADQHRCLTPALDRVSSIAKRTRPGDLWRCDDENCRLVFKVKDSPDGIYWEKLDPTYAAQLLAVHGITD